MEQTLFNAFVPKCIHIVLILSTKCTFIETVHCNHQVNPLFGTIYNSIYLMARSIHNARKAGMTLSGSNVAYYTKNTNFDGFNQRFEVDSRGQVKTSYVVLDSDSKGAELYQAYVVDLRSGVLRFTGRSIHFPGGSPPVADSSCWFEENAVCTGGTSVAMWVGQCSTGFPLCNICQPKDRYVQVICSP